MLGKAEPPSAPAIVAEPVHALGNGQIPAVAAVAWQLLSGSLIPPNEAALKEAA